ncbi:MAG: Lrp/AsnC ligand binding domain-containing protein [Lewinellaceae bacterium]|jgi:Lrp/AsnC family transcriptional regulator for asnA, asnC and gidA|nr:Lrp/AsnC ligand binding domain-containing protein [Lewinellaceae bacterium]
MTENPDIDQLDRQILAKLVEDGKMPYTDIAKQLFVSSGTIHVRMKKMEQMGIVLGSSLTVDYHKLGYDVTAFLGIYLDKSSLYDEVAEHLKNIPEIVEANYTTGLYSIFARIVCKDTNHLRLVLHDKIQKIPGIQRTETFISLEQSISRPVNFMGSEKTA